MISLVKKFTFIAPVFLALTSVALAFTPEPLPNNPLTYQGLLDLTERILGVLFTVLVIWAIYWILMAGIGYIQAKGDPEKTKVENQKILYAAIGIGIALFAKGIEALVRSVSGGGG